MSAIGSNNDRIHVRSILQSILIPSLDCTAQTPKMKRQCESWGLEPVESIPQIETAVAILDSCQYFGGRF